MARGGEQTLQWPGNHALQEMALKLGLTKVISLQVPAELLLKEGASSLCDPRREN